MIDEVPITTVVAALAFIGGTALGVVARHMHFCTLGAIVDAFLTDNHKRLRGWMLAMATAIFFTQAFHIFGLIDVYGSIYLVPSFGRLGAIIGGICFGFGTALVGTCGYLEKIRATLVRSDAEPGLGPYLTGVRATHKRNLIKLLDQKGW